ncbi:ribose-phosphate diphosphokinase [Grimontia kaedaensis]|uniref:Ribose-phosphate diphosphokinase n=1 Tax=Grimontia kaedaensis TaxID=2872157 RepID=A0ABY4WZF6_9GAMM|nr:ribose-phosphate diphosphokinase [Grimontia kaedaensis]USH04356.1 ribose-phosphate diphosphokinase [Grimontia kaedaensis]
MKISAIDQVGNIRSVNTTAFTFSGGEEQVRVDVEQLENAARILIKARIQSSSDLMKLLMTTDAIKRATFDAVPIELTLPYFPYARQDRVCVEGEALGAAVMASLINQQGFAKVTLWDVHSDVSTALVERVNNVSQAEIFTKCEALVELMNSDEVILVSPDAGASKKTQKLAEIFDGRPSVIQAQKVRDLKTGEIVKTVIEGNVEGKSVLIADDICDGGRTFIELAKVLKSAGADKVSLFVTHGIFSNGMAVFDGFIDEVYTTDSFKAKEEYDTAANVTLNVISL